MTFVVLLNAIRNGTRNQSFLKKAAVVDNPEGITLEKVFCDEIIKKHPHVSVSGGDITKIETEMGTDLLDLINLPISNTFNIIRSTNESHTINAHFDVNLAVGESIPENRVSKWNQMIENNKVRTIPVKQSKFTIEDVHKLQKEYIAASNKQLFLKNYGKEEGSKGKPDYNVQFDCVIEKILIDAKLGSKTNSDVSTLDKAIRATRECVKKIHHDRSKFQRNAKSLFDNSFLLKNTEDAVITKTKRDKDVVVILNQDLLRKLITEIKQARALYPKYYHEYVDEEKTMQRGRAILDELTNMERIVDKYLETLLDQGIHNKNARTKDTGRKPTSEFTSFDIIKGKP